MGDSRYDHEAASRQGLDFIFAKGWSEFADWPAYFTDKDVLIVENLAQLSKSFRELEMPRRQPLP